MVLRYFMKSNQVKTTDFYFWNITCYDFNPHPLQFVPISAIFRPAISITSDDNFEFITKMKRHGNDFYTIVDILYVEEGYPIC